MAGPTDILGRLREAAQQAIVRNEAALGGAAAPPPTLEERAKRWWDVPAKYKVASGIAEDERRRSIEAAHAVGLPDAHNNTFDAMRHARWSQRSAEAVGPIFTTAAGLAHEADNLRDSFRRQGVAGPYARERDKGLTPGKTYDESRMDMHNNLEGIRAALEGRPIDPARLRTFPETPPASALYRYPPTGVEGLPPR